MQMKFFKQKLSKKQAKNAKKQMKRSKEARVGQRKENQGAKEITTAAAAAAALTTFRRK